MYARISKKLCKVHKTEKVITALCQKIENVLTVQGSKNIIESTKLSELTKSTTNSIDDNILCNITTKIGLDTYMYI